MITIDNYFAQIKNIDMASLPETLRKSHDYLEKATESGSNWQPYKDSQSIHQVVDLYLSKLNAFVNKNSGTAEKSANKIQRQKESKGSKKVSKPEGQPDTTSNRQTDQSPAVTTGAKLVERIPEELRFIKRFVGLDGKTKTREEILRFINSLQKSILEKRIRKTSRYAEEIRHVQEKLIELYNGMKQKIKIALKPETHEAFKMLAAGEKVLPSINFIKRYIGLNGKPGMKEKAKQLLMQINRAIDKGRIPENDPYTTEVYEIKKNLKQFTTSKTTKTLEIEKTVLNGLEGILGCACDSLNGHNQRPAVMNSMDFANLRFNTIGLKGKWLELIGDPSPNFTAMVFGKPKMGKSYLCIEFAGYLAHNHGKVLYVAKEEGLDMTLQKKLMEKNVAHPNLTVAAVLPTNLSSYDFIFLDSVNRLGLGPDDLQQLKTVNPTKSFVFIFQSTKDGKFRGANTFQHDVDVVIEVPEAGRAHQMGRFNQGGQIDIFS
jgi:hypothetical protein